MASPGSSRFVLEALLTVPISGAQAAELGDVNGDGRVSYADAYVYGQWRQRLFEGRVPPVEPVPGSADFSSVFPCTESSGRLEFLLQEEGLRRLVTRPLPHFIEIWPSPVSQAALPPPDDRVQVRIRDSFADGQDQYVEIHLHFETAVELRGLCVVLKGDGIDLRPFPRWKQEIKPYVINMLSNTEDYIVSGGLLCFYTSPHLEDTFPPGSYDLLLPVEIPLGTAAGRYQIEFIEGTEAVTMAGEGLRPRGEAGILHLMNETTEGHNLPFPPIQFAPGGERRIEGGFEVKLSEVQETPGFDVEAVLSVKAGRPVNYAYIRVNFDSRYAKVENVLPLYSPLSTDFRKTHPRKERCPRG